MTFENSTLAVLLTDAITIAKNNNTLDVDLTQFSKVFLREANETYEYYSSIIDEQDGWVSKREYYHYTLEWLIEFKKEFDAQNQKTQKDQKYNYILDPYIWDEMKKYRYTDLFQSLLDK